MDAADTVGHGDHGTLGLDVGRQTQALDAGLQQFADFGGVQLHG